MWIKKSIFTVKIPLMLQHWGGRAPPGPPGSYTCTKTWIKAKLSPCYDSLQDYKMICISIGPREFLLLWELVGHACCISPGCLRFLLKGHGQQNHRSRNQGGQGGPSPPPIYKSAPPPNVGAIKGIYFNCEMDFLSIF